MTWYLVGLLIIKQISLAKTEEKFEANQVVQLNRVPKNVDDGDINIMNDEDDADADADVDVDMSHEPCFEDKDEDLRISSSYQHAILC